MTAPDPPDPVDETRETLAWAIAHGFGQEMTCEGLTIQDTWDLLYGDGTAPPLGLINQ